ATGAEHAVEASAFVVAAGALNSARLLLASRSADFPEGLGNTEGVLGRYLHDHPYAQIEVGLGRPLSIYPGVYVTRPPHGAVPPLRGASCTLWSGTGIRLRRLMSLTPDKSAQLGFNLFRTLPPDPRNGIALRSGQTDADGMPAVDLRMRFDDATPGALAQARDRLLGILDAAGLSPAVRSWVIHEPGSSVHYGGTVRMHSSPRYGMLDSWNRLHAAPNVLVTDSACFTTGPEKNPTLTAMALAARAG